MPVAAIYGRGLTEAKTSVKKLSIHFFSVPSMAKIDLEFGRFDVSDLIWECCPKRFVPNFSSGQYPNCGRYFNEGKKNDQPVGICPSPYFEESKPENFSQPTRPM